MQAELEMWEEECLEILGRHSLGRVAIVVDGQPQIFPVNYAINGRTLAIRTAAGSKLSHAPNSKVAFEIDEYDSSAGVGWSVMVQGTIRDITEAADEQALELRRLSPRPAAPGTRNLMLALVASRVSGRRFGDAGIVRPLPF